MRSAVAATNRAHAAGRDQHASVAHDRGRVASRDFHEQSVVLETVNIAITLSADLAPVLEQLIRLGLLSLGANARIETKRARKTKC